jgi:hypothetical protein
MSRESKVAEGVQDAWDFWLSQHPVTVPEIIEAAAVKAFREWLDEHSDEIIAAIADANRPRDRMEPTP